MKFVIAGYHVNYESLQSNIKKETGTDKLSSVFITISSDENIDQKTKDSYMKLLKKKYGSEVEIDWTQSKSDNKVSTRSKGKYDTNVSVTAIK